MFVGWGVLINLSNILSKYLNSQKYTKVVSYILKVIFIKENTNILKNFKLDIWNIIGEWRNSFWILECSWFASFSTFDYRLSGIFANFNTAYSTISVS